MPQSKPPQDVIEQHLIEIFDKTKEWVEMEFEFRKKFYKAILDKLDDKPISIDVLLTLSETYKNLNDRMTINNVVKELSKATD